MAQVVDRETRADVAELLVRYASLRKTHDPLGHSLHRITNQGFAWAGDAIAVRSYVDALVLLADHVRGAQSAGFYGDVVLRTGEGWKIARRSFTMVRLQMLGSK